MATTTIQSKYVFWEVSENNVDWLKLVCLEKQGWNVAKSDPVRKTQCGTFYGDSVPEESVPVEGMADLTPDAIIGNKGEASFSKMYLWARNGALLHFRRIIYADPTIAVPVAAETRTGRCKVGDYSEELDMAGGVQLIFTGTFQIQGDVTVVNA